MKKIKIKIKIKKVESHQDIFKCGGLDTLVQYSFTNTQLSHYIADIIGSVCNSGLIFFFKKKKESKFMELLIITGKHLDQILESNVLKCILHFGKSEDFDLQYWAIALLFNLIELSGLFFILFHFIFYMFYFIFIFNVNIINFK